MSRLITLPDGRQVTGCKNYVRTPKPGLLIDSRIEVGIALDAAGLKAGTPLSLYVRGETSNTQTPLRMWLSATTMPAAAEVTPEQFRAGFRVDTKKVGTDQCVVMFNCTAGSYKLWHFAAMLTAEMDESHVIQQFNQYYV